MSLAKPFCQSLAALALTSLLNTPGNATPPLCGEPPVKARIAALKLPSAIAVTPETVNFYIPVISRANLDELNAAFGTPTEEATAIIRKIRKMWPPFETHRISMPVLRKVLASGGILSYRELEKRGVKTDPPSTPVLEDELFGGYDCVFTSVGAPQGRGKYGEIVLIMHDKGRPRSWASASSGWRFMKDYRNATSREATPIREDDILAFSHTIFAHSEWKQAYPILIAMFLRAKPEKEKQELYPLLLNETDRRRFWQTIDDRWLGYLEGKQGGALMLSDIETIEVPAENYAEILSWPNIPKEKIRKLPHQNAPMAQQ